MQLISSDKNKKKKQNKKNKQKKNKQKKNKTKQNKTKQKTNNGIRYLHIRFCLCYIDGCINSMEN